MQQPHIMCENRKRMMSLIMICTARVLAYVCVRVIANCVIFLCKLVTFALNQTHNLIVAEMATVLAGTVLTTAVYLARRYLIGGVCASNAMLDGKTAIVTGANSGIGKETAIDLAKRNARVIVACRSNERGQKAVADIRERSGNTNVYFRPLDLASFSSVHQFASGVLSDEPKIDILINNAAVFLVPYSKTVDGVETHFSVNYLGHFLLTNLLLDRLREAPSARIINVAADIPPLVGRLTGGIDFNDINSERSYNRIKAYTQSKYAVLLYSANLAQQLKGSSVTVSTVHPGVVRNEFGRNTSYFFGYVQVRNAIALVKHTCTCSH